MARDLPTPHLSVPSTPLPPAHTTAPAVLSTARAALVWAVVAALAACQPPAQSEGPAAPAGDGGLPFADATQLDATGAAPDAAASDLAGTGGAAAADGLADGATGGVSDGAAPADAAGPADASEPQTADATAACAPADKLCSHTFGWPAGGSEQGVEVRGSWNGWQAGVPLVLQGGAWSATVALPQGQDIQYKFRVTTAGGDQWQTDPQNPVQADDGFGGKNSLLAALSCPDSGTCPVPQTVCGVPAKPSAFDWRDGVLYFVFVDRFANGNPQNDKPASKPGLSAIANWHGGDWQGVTAKIQEGYFKDLGVNVLWLSVPVDNTDAVEGGDDGQLYTAYHGYWPRDITKTNAHFGTMQELQALVTAAHAQGIQVILDYAMNHLHKDAPLFQQQPAWFHPPQKDGQPCTCGSGVCPWDGPSGVWCWFRDYLPDFDFDVAAARNASIDNVIWWMQQSGADGLRLDAIKHVEGAWLTALRQRLTSELEVQRGQHIWLVGETYTGDQAMLKSFVGPCTQLDGQFDFALRALLDQTVLLRQGSMKTLESFMIANDSYYGPGAVMSTFIGNHDLPRVIHYAEDPPVFGDVWDVGKSKAWTNLPQLPTAKAPFERVFVAMAVLMGSPGVPLIYYGDEIGLPGGGDPDNRRPMQWTGLDTNQQWLRERHQAMGKIRKDHVALRRGQRQSLWSTQHAWLWAMVSPAETVYVAVNRGDGDETLQGLPAGAALVDLLSGEAVTGPSLAMPPRSARMLVAAP